MAKKQKPGNAGCTLCGLRASSKNVAIRSIFPIWPEDVEHNMVLGMFENCVRITTKDEKDYFSVNIGLPEGRKKPFNSDAEALAIFLREYRDFDPELKHIEKIFCRHRWRQDPGTETV